MQACAREAIAAGHSAERDDQPQLPGRDGASQQVKYGGLVPDERGSFGLRDLLYGNWVVQASCMPDCCHRPKPVLDPADGRGQACWVADVDDLVADSGAR